MYFICIKGKFNFLHGFVPRNTLTGCNDFLQLLKADSGEKREVYFGVDKDSLFRRPFHFFIHSLHLKPVLYDRSDRQCSYRQYQLIN